nr:hypothetical protein [Tanacetum cinerariifolium]
MSATSSEPSVFNENVVWLDSGFGCAGIIMEIRYVGSSSVRASRIICLQSERKRMATAYCSRPTKFCHYKWLCVVLMMVLLDMELHFLNLLPYKSG